MSSRILPVDARSVATARMLLRDALEGYQHTSTDDAIVMISELVTNAVRHARAWLRVGVSIDDHTLHVEVSDDDPTLPAAPAPDLGATSGRGLRIVEAL